MRSGSARLLLAASVACGLGACGDGSGAGTQPDGSPAQQPPVEVRSVARQRYDTLGVETVLVYKAGRMRGAGRLIAREEPGSAPRLFPSPTVTLIVFRDIPEDLAGRAAERKVAAGQAYLLVGDLAAAALDVDPLLTDLAFERLREVDLALADEALAEALGMKMEAPPPGAEDGIAFQAGDDARLPFFLWVR